MRNKRLIITGGVLIALAVVFFLFFLSIAGKSSNPAELMRTVGAVSGVGIAIGIVMIVAGALGKKIG